MTHRNRNIIQKFRKNNFKKKMKKIDNFFEKWRHENLSASGIRIHIRIRIRMHGLRSDAFLTLVQNIVRRVWVVGRSMIV